eukprot:292073-Karenia_brevis.AAC.1
MSTDPVHLSRRHASTRAHKSMLPSVPRCVRQPLRRQTGRWLCMPLTTYSESVRICTSLISFSSTCSTAESSARWFVCKSPVKGAEKILAFPTPQNAPKPARRSNAS